MGWWTECWTPPQCSSKLTQGKWLQSCTPLRQHMATLRRKCPSMVSASDVVWKAIELWSLCGSTYILRCTPSYPCWWSSRCCSSSLDNSLSRTLRSRQPVAQWKGEGVHAENWGSSRMGESSWAKDSSITSLELHLEGCHPKLARLAAKNWWRCRRRSRWPDPGRLWCGGLLVS
jgi:hypothetical protein